MLTVDYSTNIDAAFFIPIES